jgi:hypothetical protein
MDRVRVELIWFKPLGVGWDSEFYSDFGYPRMVKKELPDLIRVFFIIKTPPQN